MSKERDTSSFWKARSEREYPDIYHKQQNGELPNVGAAAIRAGLSVQASPLQELRQAWERCSAWQRAQFLKEIAQ